MSLKQDIIKAKNGLEAYNILKKFNTDRQRKRRLKVKQGYLQENGNVPINIIKQK
jgi:hypothetical protein